MAAGFALWAASPLTLGQQRGAPATPSASSSARQMSGAAAAFLATLTAAQRDAATYPFTAENRTNWSNVPMFVHARPGLRFADLTNRQRQAGLTLGHSQAATDRVRNNLRGIRACHSQPCRTDKRRTSTRTRFYDISDRVDGTGKGSGDAHTKFIATHTHRYRTRNGKRPNPSV